jgi:cysteine desulfurase/selenocysteine lyase
MPLLKHLGLGAPAAPLSGLYNTTDEVDALVSGLELCRDLFAEL